MYLPYTFFPMLYKTRFFLLLFVLFFTVSLHAQQAGNYSLLSPLTNKPSLNKTWEVYIKPLALADPITGTLQVGLQKNISNRFAVAFDYGLRMTAFSYYYKRSERLDYRYSKSILELKYDLRKIRRIEASNRYHYVSLRGFYFPQTYTKTNDYVTLNGTSYHYDVSTVKRTVFSVDVVTGYQLYGKRFSYTTYVGLGVRSLNIQHNAHGLQQSVISEPIDFHFTSIDRQQGTFLRPDLVLGFQLGYRFGG